MFIPPNQLYGSPEQTENGVIVIDTESKARALADHLESHDGIVAVDTETVDVNPKCESPVGRGRVVCWSVAYRGARGVKRIFLWWSVSGPLHKWLASSKPKCGHNIWTFDRHVINNMGVQLGGVVGDTARMARFWKTDKRFKVGLKHLMYLLFRYELGSFAGLFSRPTGGKVTTRNELGKSNRLVRGVKVPTTLGLEYQNVSFVKTELIPLDDIPTLYPDRLISLYDYASLDAKATLELYEYLVERLADE